MQLVYLSPVPWSSFSQRPHKFVDWFHERAGGDVLWIDPYPTRFPAWGDWRRIGVRKDLVNYRIPHWLTVVRPQAFPIEPLPVSGLVNGVLWRDLFKLIERFALNASTMVAIGKPSVLALEMLKNMNGIPFLYDAMDNFPAFYSGISRLAMASREKSIVQQVTHLFVSSTALQKRWCAVCGNVQLVRNGLDVNVMPDPRFQVNKRSRKVLGYVGTIGLWFDWDWVIALARARPNDTVRLIGPVFVPPSGQVPSNIELLPPLEHAAALQAMLDFDVGLIPFKLNDLTASVDPIKYYEYRALGLPVVSTAFGEMALRADEQGIFLSDGLQDIKDLINEALIYRPDADEIRQFRANNSWQARFEATGILP
ncbi:glycosyltransferase [Desulfotomaculum nigrificans CO-1-SRB]|uniref:Glycosyltransferase n=1 Tax=Desulfotomaculum nigrificans (strain DSM 14880 / VKM B-2319 / CO-1-SRB) TaxID=868595 RepID=F6B5J4_DESCC|nr:glycosyltransferase [Desulfotomaculum nigrificans CO-1-SRB]